MSRELAVRILCQVEKNGLFAAPLLDRDLQQSRLSSLDKALTTELVYGALRWRERLDRAFAPLLRSPWDQMDPKLRWILRVAAYQLLFLNRTPAFAVVDEAVRMATSFFSSRQGGFVNAVLRRMAEAPPRVQRPEDTTDLSAWAAFYSHPAGLILDWIHRFGPEEARSLMEANNAIPHLGIQVHLLRTDSSRLREVLASRASTMEPGLLVPDFLRLQGLRGLRDAPGYDEGWFQVMDEASALIPYLLEPRPGEEILDACAGKGGKAALLGQLMANRGRIIAVDRNPKALRVLRANARRLGISIIEPVAADVRQILAQGGARFDRILLDVPCSGLGTLARHPEIKWRNPLASLPQLHALQVSLLRGVAPALRPGGILLYATCSPQPEEDEAVIEEFLGSHPAFVVEDLSAVLPRPAPGLITPQGYLRTFPHRHRTDAFFAARLRCRRD